MSATASIAPARWPGPGENPRVAFLGPAVWLDACAPPVAASGSRTIQVVCAGEPRAGVRERLEAFAPAITVIFCPDRFEVDELRELPGLTLGVLTDSIDEELGLGVQAVAGALDRVLCFRPRRSGARLGTGRIWRAIPPPVADRWFAEVSPLHDRPLAMTLGRSTDHRERVLLPAKHHHDILQVVHGVGGDGLAELLREYPVAVYVPPVHEGGFGSQVALHLAAGQLLIAEGLDPLHGLEPGLDFLAVRVPDELVHRLDRFARFPEMHQRMRLRGRMKAEGYRASTVFARVLADLVGDVATFGSDRR